MNVKNLPNMITALRIIGTVALLFCKNYALSFFIIFTVCGLTDVLDGYIARKTNSMSALGAQLDSVADLLFYAVMGVKLLPDLIRILPLWMWAIVGAIVFTRILCYIITAMRFKCFAAMHTYMNKLTGFAVFTIPYTIITDYFVEHSILISIIAILSTAEELLMTILMKAKYEPKRTIFEMFSKKKIAA